MELTDELKALFIDTAKTLKGSDRRIFMARVVKILGKGWQRRADRKLNWNRGTIRKGTRELESGFICQDAFSARGRKPAEEHLPNLLDDIKAIVDGQSQTDPTFKTTRLYTRLSAAEVRRQLILQKGYSDDELPSEETIRVKLNKLGYTSTACRKADPRRRYPKQMPFLSNWTRYTGRQMKTKRCYAFLWTPKQRFLLDSSPETARHALLSKPWITTLNPMRS